MLKPNTGRIIVELIRTGDKEGDIYLPTRENVKAGENLLIGKVIHPGEGEYSNLDAEGLIVKKPTQFKEGQLVMFQEYSMSGVYKDVQALVEGKVTQSEAQKPENQYHIIAITDIMGYDD